MTMSKCGMKTEVFSRVCGYYRPVANWNKGKQDEYEERATFDAVYKNLPSISNNTNHPQHISELSVSVA